VPPLTESSTPEQRRHAADDVFHCLCCRRRHGDNVSPSSNPRRITSGPLSALDQRDPIADPSPRFIARQHDVRFELIRGGKHERVRKPQASGLAPQLRCHPRDRRRQRLETDGEVREERFDLGHRLGPAAIRGDEDLCIRRCRNRKLVVLVLGESFHRRIVKRVVRIEKRDGGRSVEDD